MQQELYFLNVVSLHTDQDAENVFLELSAISRISVSQCPIRLKEHLKERTKRVKSQGSEKIGVKLSLDPAAVVARTRPGQDQANQHSIVKPTSPHL